MSRRSTSGSEWSRYYRLDGPISVEALHAHFVAHRYPRHVHDYLVVGLVESGAQSYSYRGARHITPAGSIFLVNAGEPHTGEAATSGGYVYRALYQSTDCLARAADDVSARCVRPGFRGAVVDDPPLAASLFRFHRSLAENAPNSESELHLLRALARLIECHTSPGVILRSAGKEWPACKCAREYIDAYFAEEVSLSKLADLVSLSPYYFARSFEREIGLPPHAYLESVRIKKARELLDQGHTIVSAALLAGFGDQSHLTRRFKQFLGITPGQYVRESKIRQDR